MIKYVNECIGCASPAFPCLGDKCPNRNVPKLFCEECGYEADDLYYNHGKQVCEECLIKSHTKVSVEEEG